MGGELSGSEDGLVGYWKFNEGSGTTAFDSSPNGNHGTIYNATWTTDAAPDITLVITQEPTPVSAPAGTVTNLAVTVTGMNPRYQWYKDTVAIPDATNSVLVFDPLQPSDAGSYYVVVTNSNNAVTSATVAVTVTGTDTTPPTVDLVEAGGSVRSVTVVFSERVSDATATDARNYQITDALGGTVEVTEASLAADGRTVTLTTAESMQDAEYTLVITGVQDLATPPNTIAEGTSQTFVLATILGDWQFSEASSATGTTADSSGNGYDGTLVDFDAGTGLTGDGQVLFADNNANRVTTELPLSLLSTNFMVDITFTYTGEGDRMWTPLLGSSQAPYSPAQIFYIGKNNLNTQLHLGLGGIYLGAVTPPVNLFDGAQHRLVVTFSRADRELKLYADGSDTPFFTLAPTPVAAGYFTGTSSLWIGAVGHAYAGGETWVGSLDRVIVRNAISIFEPPILPLAFLSPVLVDGKIILNWTGTGRLESAPSVLGPWEEVTPQPTTPPYPEDLVPGGNRYFRLNATPAPENTLGLVDASGTRQQGTSLDAIRFVAESSFSADTMHARFTDTSAPGVMRMAIYADDGSDAPGTVLGDTFQFDIGGGGLRSAALNTPVEITEGNVYWIATWVQTVSANATFVATDGVGTRYRATPTYSATDPFPDGSTLSFSAETTYAVFASGM